PPRRDPRPPLATDRRRRRASRTPGPTRVWPPRSTGTAASRADLVSARSHGSPTSSWRSKGAPKADFAVAHQPRAHQVGREAVLRARPLQLIRPEAVGEQNAAVDQGGIPETGENRA